MTYLRTFNTKATPQAQPIPGTVPNSAGGHSFPIDDWTQFWRFLVLGSEQGTYYIGQGKLTRDNAAATERCIKVDGLRVVQTIVDVSRAGRAPKNDPALFALAMCAKLGDEPTKRAAYAALPQVARIGTHLFHFAAYVELFGGWGQGLKRAVQRWYNRDDLALQTVKYQARDGWSHRDLLRLSHPKSENPILHWIVKGEPIVDGLIAAVEEAKTADTKRVCALIRNARLPRECIPTEKLNERDVWEALLEEMPLTAMLRNLATMTRVGLITPMATATGTVADRLANGDLLRRARVHPIQVLAALKTYAAGKGERGKNTWEPVRQIVDALDAAFYVSFGNVEPTGKRLVLGLDVSGSMAGTVVNGVPGLSAREACAAMALVTAAVEQNYEFVAFDTNAYQLALSPRQRLDDVVHLLARTGGGGTNCALPILAAQSKNWGVDAFVILTDSETWQGNIHPIQAVQAFRRASGVDAKLITVAMAANGYTLGAAKDDPLCMDVIGFDTATPNLISEFVR